MGNSDRQRPCVFFDRDGVLIEAAVRDGKPYPPRDLVSMRIVGSAAANVGLLRMAGFVNVVVTNQPDVRRGTQTLAMVEIMNQALLAVVPIDAVFTCYHDDSDQCECRKPGIGLLLQASERFDVDLHRSFVVGDRWRDIEAGRRAGCRTVLIDFDYKEKTVEPDVRVRTLEAAIKWILRSKD